MSQEAIDELEQYLKDGGCIKKDCWLNAMQMQYDIPRDCFNLLDRVSTSTGERILGVRESFKKLSDVPYAGKWLKCDEKGELLE